MIGSRLGLHRLFVGCLVASGVVVSGLVVTGSSYSVFSGSTSNPSSNWAAGNVVVSDDDLGAALFTVAAMRPGQTGTKCIEVTSRGSVPSIVKLYTTPTSPTYATTNALASSIALTVTQGTGGTTANACSGFAPLASGATVYSGTLAGFAAAAAGYSSGLPTTSAWAPTGGSPETRTYQFTYTLDANAPSTTQNGTATIGFTWEAQNS